MNKKIRINQLTKVEKLKLVKEICRICELQYRKGYQHGFMDNKDGLVSEKDVNNFRWKGSEQGYSKVINPPNFKRKESPISRIFSELDMPNMEILQSIFLEVKE